MTQVSRCTYCGPCNQGDTNCANSYFNMLRIVEDRDWQANMRQIMKTYINQVPSDDPNSLQTDLDFYEKFSFKSLSDKTNQIAKIFDLGFKLTENYFPWNRTFEIGLVGDFSKQSSSKGSSFQDFISKKLEQSLNPLKEPKDVEHTNEAFLTVEEMSELK